MTAVPNCVGNDRKHSTIYHYSDNELIFKDLYLKCLSLESQKLKMGKIKQNLLTTNEKNESISKSLLKIKTDYESHISFLNKTLYDLKMSTNKQKVLLRNELDNFSNKRKTFETYYKLSPIKCELEELTNKNRSLEEEWKKNIHLFELTKNQYYELLNKIVENFKRKVCEFCDAVLKHEVNFLKN